VIKKYFFNEATTALKQEWWLNISDESFPIVDIAAKNLHRLLCPDLS
jgi:hypothetical protein